MHTAQKPPHHKANTSPDLALLALLADKADFVEQRIRIAAETGYGVS